MKESFKSTELYLIYNPATDLGKKTRAMAEALGTRVHEIDVIRHPLTPLRWKEVVDLLGLKPLTLINHDDPDFIQLIGNDSYSEKDALEILHKNPELLVGPIGVLHDRAVLCDDPKDVFKLEGHFEAHERF